MVTFEKQVAPEGAVRLWQGEEYRHTNGSKIHVFGLDDPERLKSAELDLIYVQEVSELEQTEWELLTTRATGRGGTMPYQQAIADLNPREPGWWLYEREAAGKTTFLFARHAHNPTITPERLAPLEALTGYLRDRLLLGLRVAAEGQYFTETWQSRTSNVPQYATLPPTSGANSSVRALRRCTRSEAWPA
jgi:phage terminase large subunit